MAKLSAAALETGRNHIRAKDLDGFIRWVDAVDVPINQDIVRSTFEQCFAADRVDAALKIFEAGWGEAKVSDLSIRGQSRARLAGKSIGFGCLVLCVCFVVGAIGGAVYVIQWLVSL